MFARRTFLFGAGAALASIGLYNLTKSDDDTTNSSQDISGLINFSRFIQTIQAHEIEPDRRDPAIISPTNIKKTGEFTIEKHPDRTYITGIATFNLGSDFSVRTYIDGQPDGPGQYAQFFLEACVHNDGKVSSVRVCVGPGIYHDFEKDVTSPRAAFDTFINFHKARGAYALARFELGKNPYYNAEAGVKLGSILNFDVYGSFNSSSDHKKSPGLVFEPTNHKWIIGYTRVGLDGKEVTYGVTIYLGK